MSGAVIVLIVAALGVGALGLQVLSSHFQHSPLDIRRPKPLISTRRGRREAPHSAELRRLSAVVSNAILNDRTAKVELQSVFNELGATAPPLGDSTDARRDRHRRSQQLEQAVADLERRWDSSGGGSSRSVR